jgi:hypothetical protein
VVFRAAFRRFESRWGRQSKLARSLIFLPRNLPIGFSDRSFSVGLSPPCPGPSLRPTVRATVIRFSR